MSFNLSALALKDTTTFQLRHPVTGEELFADSPTNTQPVEFEIHGTSSKVWRQAVAAMAAKQKRRGNNKNISVEVMREDNAELLANITESITNLDIDGQALDNQDAYKALYLDSRFNWVKDQVDAQLGDNSGFLTQSENA
jgi:hypothetical protein